MLPVHVETVRLFLHVLAATIWVGGQLTVAGLLPTIRGLGPDAPRQVARRFNVIAWGAFAVLVVTGIWNIASVHLSDQSDSYKATLAVKIVVVALSGASAFAHARTSNRMLIALGGALGGLTAVVALFLGVLLH